MTRRRSQVQVLYGPLQLKRPPRSRGPFALGPFALGPFAFGPFAPASRSAGECPARAAGVHAGRVPVHARGHRAQRPAPQALDLCGRATNSYPARRRSIPRGVFAQGRAVAEVALELVGPPCADSARNPDNSGEFRIRRRPRCISVVSLCSVATAEACTSSAPLSPRHLHNSEHSVSGHAPMHLYALGRDGRTTRESGCRSSNPHPARGAPRAGTFFFPGPRARGLSFSGFLVRDGRVRLRADSLWRQAGSGRGSPSHSRRRPPAVVS